MRIMGFFEFVVDQRGTEFYLYIIRPGEGYILLKDIQLLYGDTEVPDVIVNAAFKSKSKNLFKSKIGIENGSIEIHKVHKIR